MLWVILVSNLLTLAGKLKDRDIVFYASRASLQIGCHICKNPIVKCVNRWSDKLFDVDLEQLFEIFTELSV